MGADMEIMMLGGLISLQAVLSAPEGKGHTTQGAYLPSRSEMC